MILSGRIFTCAVFMLLCTLFASNGYTEVVKPLLREAYLAENNQNDTHKAIDYMLLTLEKDTQLHELDKKLHNMARGILFSWIWSEMEKKTKTKSDEAVCNWLGTRMARAEAFAPSAKELRESVDSGVSMYPPLLLISANCQGTKGMHALSKATYNKARRLSKGLVGTWKEIYYHVLPKAKANLKAFDPFAIGAYVTNVKGSQKWIGKIIAVNGPLFEVELTYAYKGGDYKKGQRLHFKLKQLKALTHVSMEAALNGWE